MSKGNGLRHPLLARVSHRCVRASGAHRNAVHNRYHPQLSLNSLISQMLKHRLGWHQKQAHEPVTKFYPQQSRLISISTSYTTIRLAVFFFTLSSSDCPDSSTSTVSRAALCFPPDNARQCLNYVPGARRVSHGNLERFRTEATDSAARSPARA